MDKEKTRISVESTPNPQSIKFTVDRTLTTKNWETGDSSQSSPLAEKIMGFPWATKIFIGSNFITVTKEEWVDWDILIEPLSQMIKEHIDEGKTVLHLNLQDEKQNEKQDGGGGEDSEVVRKIKTILEKDIQPAVAMDGGFISFAKYEKGVVFLKLQGACSGCPSSSFTLKQGIENHLKKYIPEVKEVMAL